MTYIDNSLHNVFMRKIQVFILLFLFVVNIVQSSTFILDTFIKSRLSFLSGWSEPLIKLPTYCLRMYSYNNARVNNNNN